MERENRKETLCWRCQNARANRCSWFTDYTPVEGWDADVTVINNQYSNGSSASFISSYKVKQCPNFVVDEDTWREELRKNNVQFLNMNVVKFMRDCGLGYDEVRIKYGISKKTMLKMLSEIKNGRTPARLIGYA